MKIGFSKNRQRTLDEVRSLINQMLEDSVDMEVFTYSNASEEVMNSYESGFNAALYRILEELPDE